MLTSEQALTKEPLLKKDGLKGGGYYVEYRTDDARLTIEDSCRKWRINSELCKGCKAFIQK